MLLNLNIYFLFLLYITKFINFINCDEVSSNQLNLLINSYQNNVLKIYEETLQLTENGTVWNYNILFNIKRYLMNLDKRAIERNLEKLKTAKDNPSYKVDQSELVKDINSKEKSFLKSYKKLLNIMKDSNELYQQFMHILKIIFIVCISAVIIITLITIGVMVYISSPKWKNYNMLLNEKNENKNDTNENDNSKQFKVVKILNNIMKSEKKLK